jgi:tetrahydromethanopterin S-methyltransferase subunit G
MTDLTGILVPVVVATLLSVSGAFVVARYSGPAQQAYIAALQGRLSVVEQERDDAEERIPKLEARITVLETQVAQLIGQNIEKDREIAMLYRRLDADEKRLAGR